MRYLLAISIGPVQDFIAAARRTADLYAGSQLLVMIAKEAARVMERHGAELIFPKNTKDDGPNKILCVLDGDPSTVMNDVKRAARDELKRLWLETLRSVSSEQQVFVDKTRAAAQIESFLEVYAAWWPLETDDQYVEARKNVDRLLAGRKALRDFTPLDQHDTSVPKSPLDPSRASVIGSSVPEVFEQDNKLRLRKTEFLDAISLLKRVYGASERSGEVLQTRTLARRSWRPETQNTDLPPDDEDTQPEKQPYYAILVADGDKMGQLISSKTDISAHQKLSDELAKFAGRVGEIVLSHLGFLVYSGGDDVLAMLPVNTAIACAHELSTEFRHAVRGTLSAGIAIVHYREPLSMSLDHARAAEKVAKGAGRNRLAVALHTRGGQPLTVTETWDELEWDALVSAYQQNQVTRGVAYEFRELAREWPDGADVNALNSEAKRILNRKESKSLTLPNFPSAQALADYADKLVVARFLAGLGGDHG